MTCWVYVNHSCYLLAFFPTLTSPDKFTLVVVFLRLGFHYWWASCFVGCLLHQQAPCSLWRYQNVSEDIVRFRFSCFMLMKPMMVWCKVDDLLSFTSIPAVILLYSFMIHSESKVFDFLLQSLLFFSTYCSPGCIFPKLCYRFCSCTKLALILVQYNVLLLWSVLHCLPLTLFFLWLYTFACFCKSKTDLGSFRSWMSIMMS